MNYPTTSLNISSSPNTVGSKPQMCRTASAFTLVEILIVVIIVGLLSGIAIMKLADMKDTAEINYLKSSISLIDKGIEQVIAKEGTFPSIAGATPEAKLENILEALIAKEIYVNLSPAETRALASMGLTTSVQYYTHLANNVALGGFNELFNANSAARRGLPSGSPDAREILVFPVAGPIVYPEPIVMILNDPANPDYRYATALENSTPVAGLQEALDYYRQHGDFRDPSDRALALANLSKGDWTAAELRALIAGTNSVERAALIDQLSDVINSGLVGNLQLNLNDAIGELNFAINDGVESMLAMNHIDYSKLPYDKLTYDSLFTLARESGSYLDGAALTSYLAALDNNPTFIGAFGPDIDYAARDSAVSLIENLLKSGGNVAVATHFLSDPSILPSIQNNLATILSGASPEDKQLMVDAYMAGRTGVRNDGDMWWGSGISDASSFINQLERSGDFTYKMSPAFTQSLLDLYQSEDGKNNSVNLLDLFYSGSGTNTTPRYDSNSFTQEQLSDIFANNAWSPYNSFGKNAEMQKFFGPLLSNIPDDVFTGLKASAMSLPASYIGDKVKMFAFLTDASQFKQADADQFMTYYNALSSGNKFNAGTQGGESLIKMFNNPYITDTQRLALLAVDGSNYKDLRFADPTILGTTIDSLLALGSRTTAQSIQLGSLLSSPQLTQQKAIEALQYAVANNISLQVPGMNMDGVKRMAYSPYVNEMYDVLNGQAGYAERLQWLMVGGNLDADKGFALLQTAVQSNGMVFNDPTGVRGMSPDTFMSIVAGAPDDAAKNAVINGYLNMPGSTVNPYVLLSQLSDQQVTDFYTAKATGDSWGAMNGIQNAINAGVTNGAYIGKAIDALIAGGANVDANAFSNYLKVPGVTVTPSTLGNIMTAYSNGYYTGGADDTIYQYLIDQPGIAANATFTSMVSSNVANGRYRDNVDMTEPALAPVYTQVVKDLILSADRFQSVQNLGPVGGSSVKALVSSDASLAADVITRVLTYAGEDDFYNGGRYLDLLDVTSPAVKAALYPKSEELLAYFMTYPPGAAASDVEKIKQIFSAEQLARLAAQQGT